MELLEGASAQSAVRAEAASGSQPTEHTAVDNGKEGVPEGAAPSVTVLVSSAVGAAALSAAGVIEPSFTAAALIGGPDEVLKNAPRSASSTQWTTPFASVITGICSPTWRAKSGRACT